MAWSAMAAGVKPAASPSSEAGFRLRPARRGDRDAVYELLLQLGYDKLSRDAVGSALAWVLSHPEMEVVVAADALDKAIGLISFSHRPQLRLGGRIFTIDELVVSAAWRNKGVGKALLAAAVARARILGVKRVELTTHRGRDSYARAFYEKNGFSEKDSAVVRHKDFG